MSKNFRLYVKEQLSINKTITLEEEQTHYLKNVVKYAMGDILRCFDNHNGEFFCEIADVAKKHITLKVLQKTADFHLSPDIWLIFAPLKKDKTDFVIEKATELGCRKIIPAITQYTITQNVKTERYTAQSIEAAEQCRRTDLPEIAAPREISALLADWDASRTLFFMDETLNSPDFLTVLKQNQNSKAAILIGPEGGFSPEELARLRSLSYARGASLGPRILRAETAAAAALSCWQLIAGDWRK